MLNWIPSHVGLHGNDAADTVAKAAARHEGIQHELRPSHERTKVTARREVWHIQRQHMNTLAQISTTMTWYTRATGFEPMPPALRKQRKTEVAAHRLRLGYQTREYIINKRDEPCEHCTSSNTLNHYILQCPRTSALRTPLPIGNDEHERAAKAVRRAMETPDALADLLRRMPPPR